MAVGNINNLAGGIPGNVSDEAISLVLFDPTSELAKLVSLTHSERRAYLNGLASKEFIALYSAFYIISTSKKDSVGLSEVDRQLYLVFSQSMGQHGVEFDDQWIKVHHAGGSKDYWTKLYTLKSTPSPDSLSP